LRLFEPAASLHFVTAKSVTRTCKSGSQYMDPIQQLRTITMFKSTPNPPTEDLSSLASQVAIERAFAHYELPVDNIPRRRREQLTTEDALTQIDEILQSASATAYECADNLRGSDRKLALGVVYLVDLALSRVDDLLDKQAHPA